MLRAVVDASLRLVAEPLERLFHPAAPSSIGQVMSIVRGVEDLVGDLAQLLELVVAQDRLFDHELVRLLGCLGEQVALGADAVCRLITTASRIGSIGGLVTWANSCLK